MRISWINKFSLIDFPKHVSCIIFTPWCNFRCSYCHNPDFVLPELLKQKKDSIIPEKWFFEFLEKRKGLLDWVSICWWEPTLQKDLVKFCEKVKGMGFLVKLDTNWTNPEILKELIDQKLVDYIAMDLKHSTAKVKDVIAVDFDSKTLKNSIELVLNSWLDYEFRTTVVKGLHNEEDIENISKSIKGAKNYYIQNYRSWNTLVKDFSWRSFTTSELKKFRDISNEYVENVEIRN